MCIRDSTATTGAGNTFTTVQLIPAIPEPASLGLLGVASVALLARRRK